MSGWTPEEDDDLALAGEYVLGLLEGQELRAFEARLSTEPALRAHLALWSEDFASTLADTPEVAPPRRVEEALMGRLFPQERAPGLLQRWGLWPLLLGGAAVAGLAMVLALDPALMGGRDQPEFAARIAAEDESLVVQASFDIDTNRLVVERLAGEIPEGQDLELWFVRMEGGAPASTVSLGVIPREPEGVIEVSAELAAEFPDNALALSVEPLGGSPTGQATGPVVALGPLTGL